MMLLRTPLLIEAFKAKKEIRVWGQGEGLIGTAFTMMDAKRIAQEFERTMNRKAWAFRLVGPTLKPQKVYGKTVPRGSEVPGLMSWRASISEGYSDPNWHPSTSTIARRKLRHAEKARRIARRRKTEKHKQDIARAAIAATSAVHRVGTRDDPHRRPKLGARSTRLRPPKGHKPGRGEHETARTVDRSMQRVSSSGVRSLRAWMESIQAALREQQPVPIDWPLKLPRSGMVPLGGYPAGRSGLDIDYTGHPEGRKFAKAHASLFPSKRAKHGKKIFKV